MERLRGRDSSEPAVHEPEGGHPPAPAILGGEQPFGGAVRGLHHGAPYAKRASSGDRTGGDHLSERQGIQSLKKDAGGE